MPHPLTSNPLITNQTHRPSPIQFPSPPQPWRCWQMACRQFAPSSRPGVATQGRVGGEVLNCCSATQHSSSWLTPGGIEGGGDLRVNRKDGLVAFGLMALSIDVIILPAKARALSWIQTVTLRAVFFCWPEVACG